MSPRGPTVGEHCSFCGPFADGVFPELVTIGDHCVLAPNVMILTHDASRVPFTGEYIVAPTTIGNRVFIGVGAVVMPGVTIGNRCVIGANSTVTHDVESGSVMAGSPARRICGIDEFLRKDRPTVEPPFDTNKMDEVTPLDYQKFRVQVLCPDSQSMEKADTAG